MNRDEQFDKNLELVRDRLLGLLDQPPDQWPDGSITVFCPHDDPELAEANRAAMHTIQARYPDEDHTVWDTIIPTRRSRSERTDDSKKTRRRPAV